MTGFDLLFFEVGLSHTQVFLQLDCESSVDVEHVPRNELRLSRAEKSTPFAMPSGSVSAARVLVLEMLCALGQLQGPIRMQVSL